MSASRFLVTGGSQGIGAALVELAAKAGHQVVFTGRNDQFIDAVAKKPGAWGKGGRLGARGQRPHGRCLRHAHGCVDVLINNAAYDYRAEIGALDSPG